MAYRKKPVALAACMVAVATLFASPLAADVKRGVDAWTAGDFDTAVSEWREPAAQGDADALFNLGQAYRLGRGVPADIAQARQLYAQAAQKGHVKAADNYGLLLFQQGEQQDAMPLIEAAAGRGDPRAQYVLGLAHFNADYAKKDWVRAYALLTLAQGSGLPQASGALQQMDQYVPRVQREQAQALARDLEAETGKRRAAQLAAADLSQRQPGTYSTSPATVRPVRQPSAAPVRVAAAAPAGASAPVASVPARTIARLPSAAPQASSPAVVPVSAQVAPIARKGVWGVQLGAFGVAANADRLWNKLATNPALVGTQKKLVAGGRVTRLRAIGFESRAEASRACAKLNAQGQACIVAKPSA